MKNKVFGIIGLRSRFANWNSDFDGFPKRTSEEIYSSDKVLKYVIRRYLEDNGEKVFYKKTRDEEKDKMKILTYEEKYTKEFGDPKKQKPKEILENLLSFIDIKLFGTIVTFKEISEGIRGIVQISQGVNLYKNTNIITQTITTQFASKPGAIQTTLGEMIFTDESHYFYGFSINPNNIKVDFENIVDNKYLTLSDKEFDLFKKSCLYAVSNYNSTTKAGCDNSFALFIYTNNDLINLPLLIDYIDIEENENIDEDNNSKTLNIDKLIELIKLYKNDIDKVEIYYRPEFLNIKNIDEYKDIVEFNKF